MKLLFISLIAILFSFPVIKGEGPMYRATYELDEIFTYISDTLDFKGRKDILYLDLYRDKSFCFSKYTWFTDSLDMSPDGDKQWMLLFKAAMKKDKGGPIDYPSYPHYKNTFQVIKNRSDKTTKVWDFFDHQYYEYEDDGDFSWCLSDSIQEINGYNCQMATCVAYGRHWTAWFCPELPWSDGPWKFSGLPGLIVAAQDSNGFYKFNLVGISDKFKPVKPWVKDAKKTKSQDFNRLKYKYLLNLDGILNAELGIKVDYKPGAAKRYRIGIESDYPHN